MMPLMAQLDRSKAPAAAAAPHIQIGTPQSFVLKNGLKVFVVENHKIPVVTYNLSLDIIPALEGNKAGLSDLAGQMLMMGTTNRSKEVIDEEIDFVGASLRTSSSSIYGRSLKKHSSTILAAMSDVLMNPSFPEEQLAKLKKQTITGISSGKEEPGSIASNISSRMLYGANHPYGEIVSEASIEAITVQDCKEYHSAYFRPNVASLVIVGDITLKEAKKQANQFFGKWEKRNVTRATYENPQLPASSRVVVGNKDGGNQSSIRVVHLVELKPGHPDAIKANVMNSVLGGGSFSARLFNKLREDKAWTYGAYSNLSPDRIIGSFSASAQVKGEATDSALFEVVKEMQYMCDNLISEKELTLFKNSMAGSFARSLEDPATVARFALSIDRYGLPKDYYATYLEKLAAVTPEDVREMAQKYLKPDQAYLVAVGDMAKIKNSLKRLAPQQPVVMYDYYGNEVKQNVLPSGLTAEKVVENYVTAIGGNDKLLTIKNSVIKANATIQGMNISIDTYVEMPGKLCVETSMMGNVLSKQVVNGTKGKVSSPMGEQILDEQTVASMADEMVLFPEMYLSQNGTKLQLLAVEVIAGEAAYKVSAINKNGSETIMFFSADTGLKLKEIKTTPQGAAVTLIKEYVVVDGVKVPSVIVQSVGPQIIDIVVSEVKLNSQINSEIFNL